MKDIGYGKGYAYDHDAEEGFSGADYWPEEMAADLLPRRAEQLKERLAWEARRANRAGTHRAAP